MRVSTLLPVLLLLLASNVSAADKGSKERAAKRACLNGDVNKGMALLTDLYVDTGDPTHIYNQGRCLEQNNRYEEAIGRFREYLRKVSGKKHVDQAEKAEAEKHIEDCQALLAEKNRQSVPATEPGKPVAPEPPPAPPLSPPVVEPVATVALPAEPASSNRPGSGLRIAGIVTASVGGAALVGGLVFNLLANSKVHGLTPTYNKGDDSTSKTYKTLSLAGYGVGGACVAGGAVLYYLGWRAGRAPTVALLPSFSTGSAGAVLAGGF